MRTHTAFISVGSNLGDPLENCKKGIAALCDDKIVSLAACSPFYTTEPVDYLDQNWFVNAVIKVTTDLAPLELLAALQAVQGRFGRREHTVRFGPRILDLDIIFYDDIIFRSPELTLPHPRAHKRRFVLQPICDIDPTIIHPVLGVDVKTLLNQIVVEGQKIRSCS